MREIAALRREAESLRKHACDEDEIADPKAFDRRHRDGAVVIRTIGIEVLDCPVPIPLEAVPGSEEMKHFPHRRGEWTTHGAPIKNVWGGGGYELSQVMMPEPIAQPVQ